MPDDFYTITAPATANPVTLSEAKSWLRIRDSVTVDDPLVSGLITAAVAVGERLTSRVFAERTFAATFSGLCVSNRETFQFLELGRSPLITVTSVEVLVSDVFTAFTDYELKQLSGFSRLIFQNGIDSIDVAPMPIRVVFSAGYGEPLAVPDGIKAAIKAHVAFMYENRGDVEPDGKVKIPGEVHALYSTYRIPNPVG